MKYVQIAQDRVSAIGLGAWQFGAREWDWRETSRDEAFRIVDRALELGINLIDTAELYGRGRSEELIGEALKGKREKAWLASKVFPVFPTPGRIHRAAVASLARLKTSTLDLYQLHFDNPLVPLSMQMRGMKNLQAEGLIRHAGVSNFKLDRWRRAEEDFGGPVLSNQVQYHLLKRSAEEMFDWARAEGRLVIAYSPLAQGLLSGRHSADHLPSDVRRFNPLFTRRNIENAMPVVEALREIARVHGATPSQVALAWVIRGPNVVAIPGAKTVQQLEENAAAADLTLSRDESARLDHVSGMFSRSRLKEFLELPGRLLR